MNEIWGPMIIVPASGITPLMRETSRGMSISPNEITQWIRNTANEEFETTGQYFKLSHFHIEDGFELI